MANLLQQYSDPVSDTLYSRTYKVTDMSEEFLTSGVLQISKLWHTLHILINVDTNLNELYCSIIYIFLISILLNKFTRKISSGNWNDATFFAFLWFANKRTISFIVASLICSVYQPSVLNPTVKILELGRINFLPRTTSYFHFLIKFHCRFHSHDQQQRNSVIENTMLTNDRPVNDFQIQRQSCKNESGEYSKYWETHPQFYSNQDN